MTITETIRLNDRMSPVLKNINRNLNNTSGATKNASKGITAFGVTGGIVMSQLLMKAGQLATQIPEIGDAYTNMQSRMGLIVKQGENVVEVNNAIYQAAQRARGSYQAMGDSVAKLGLLAGDSFKDTNEIVGFTETLQKAFAVSGAGAQEQASAMYQLTQAMAAGKLQGDEFRSVMENAPMLADAIAKYTGKSKGELKEMSSQGTITADIIKASLLAATDDINAKFETMPVTFAQSVQMMKNKALNVFGPVLSTISSGLAKFFTWLSDNMVWVAVGAISILVGALWAIIPPLSIAAISWAIVNWQILLVMAVVAGVLSLFVLFPDALGTIVGGVYAIGTAFMNVFKYVANIWKSIIGIIIEGLNLIPGVNIKAVKLFEYGDIADSFAKGQKIGQSGAQKIKDMKSNVSGFVDKLGSSPSLEGINNSLKGSGKLASVGKIDDQVQIDDESLKMLLDVATKKFQIKYQQLTPKITATFGDIRETADVDSILSAIEEKVVSLSESSLVGA